MRGCAWLTGIDRHVLHVSVCGQAGTSTDRAGRVCASCKPKVHHDRIRVDKYPEQCCNGGRPGMQAGIRGRRTSAMGPIRTNEGCHVNCRGDINFVRVCVRGRVTHSKGGEKGAVFACAICAMGSLCPLSMVALGGILAYISPGASAYSDGCLQFPFTSVLFVPNPYPSCLVYNLVRHNETPSAKDRIVQTKCLRALTPEPTFAVAGTASTNHKSPSPPLCSPLLGM
jgi:hypothetical protein